MIALAVYLNGKKVAVAGADDLGVLSTTLSAGGTLGKNTVAYGKKRGVSVHFSVGGLTRRSQGQDEHLRWISVKPLRVGDRVSVRIIRTDRPDEHKSAVPHDPNMFRVRKRPARNVRNAKATKQRRA